MTTYYADITGEDHTEFSAECEATSIDEARAYFEEAYPDGRIHSVITEEGRQEIENARYRRLEAMIDDDDRFDDY